MKNVMEVLKDIFSNKRKRSGVGLGACILFMIFMVIMVRPQAESYKRYYSSNLNNSNTSNKSNVNITDPVELYGNMDSFEVVYTINIKENNVSKSYNITGTYFDNKYYLELNNRLYYIDDEKIYSVDEINNKLTLIDSNDKKNLFYKFDFNILLMKNTYNTIKYSQLKGKKEYKDKTSILEYLYKNYKDNTISMIMKSNNGVVNSIDYDFTNYYEKGIYQLLTINAKYDNVNNLSSFDRNYDNYLIVDNSKVSNKNVDVISNSNSTEANK